MTRDQGFVRLGGARDEFEAARFCLSRVQRSIDAGGALSPSDRVAPSDILACGENLEATYGLRLFAEFEFVLRDFLRAARPSPRPRRTKMEHLINRIRAIRSIPSDMVQQVHEVREYRNTIAHFGDLTGTLTFHDCKSRLGRFLGYLPPDW